MRKGIWTDRIMEGLVYLSGGLTLLIVVGVGFFLLRESRYAFDREFGYGFRFALQPVREAAPDEVATDPNASLVTAHRDGANGIDEKESSLPTPTIERLSGASSLATATVPDAESGELYQDDWRPMQKPSEARQHLLHAFATPEYQEPTFALAWAPDAGSFAADAPFDLQLKLLRSPAGAPERPVEVDLTQSPSGRVELPAFIARTDAERVDGYLFELTATPRSGAAAAVVNGTLQTHWDPTGNYPRFGFVPLVVGTLLVTTLAVLFAAPFSVATALYLRELAPPRIGEWLKPVIELLSSVPTVVLGYFGLMLLAPALQDSLGKALGIESGRALLTTSLVMAVLLVPVIASVAEDALKSVPTSLREGGEALGLTKGEQLRQIIVPAAGSGMIGALLLGVARAIGETMIVWMLSGGTPGMPSFGGARDLLANLMRPTRGLPDTIAIEMGNVDFEGVHYGHLFLLGLTLFAITLCINVAGNKLARRGRWQS